MPISVGAALRKIRESAGHTQEQIADATGVPQPTLSQWELDRASPTLAALEDIGAIEDACAVPRGTVLRMAGYVADEVTVEAAIENDPLLSLVLKEALLRAYGAFVEGKRIGSGLDPQRGNTRQTPTKTRRKSSAVASSAATTNSTMRRTPSRRRRRSSETA